MVELRSFTAMLMIAAFLLVDISKGTAKKKAQKKRSMKKAEKRKSKKKAENDELKPVNGIVDSICVKVASGESIDTKLTGVNYEEYRALQEYIAQLGEDSEEVPVSGSDTDDAGDEAYDGTHDDSNQEKGIANDDGTSSKMTDDVYSDHSEFQDATSHLEDERSILIEEVVKKRRGRPATLVNGKRRCRNQRQTQRPATFECDRCTKK
ncbi:hypothetical protein FOZ63_004735, partial [Perkinsus olseni]